MVVAAQISGGALTLTSGANSLVIQSGATLGVPASGLPFRLWLVQFDDAGTARLGIINTFDDGSIVPLRPGLSASSQTMTVNADQAGVFYTDTPVQGKGYTVLARLCWPHGLGAVGTWASVPTIRDYQPGHPLPCDVIQRREIRLFDTAPYQPNHTHDADTEFADTRLGGSIDVCDAVNMIDVSVFGVGDIEDGAVGRYLIFQGGAPVGPQSVMYQSGGATLVQGVALFASDFPALSGRVSCTVMQRTQTEGKKVSFNHSGLPNAAVMRIMEIQT